MNGGSRTREKIVKSVAGEQKTSLLSLKIVFETRKVRPLTAILFQTIVGGFIRGRKVRTPQGTVAVNDCPPRGED